MVATHVDPGIELNEVAQRLIDEMCDADDRSLGKFQKLLISYPMEALEMIRDLNNGWEHAGKVVFKFATFLKENIYDKGGGLAYDSDDESILDDKTFCADIKPWPVLKSVIGIFDQQIYRLGLL
jgi:hypothetical protein